MRLGRAYEKLGGDALGAVDVEEGLVEDVPEGLLLLEALVPFSPHAPSLPVSTRGGRRPSSPRTERRHWVWLGSEGGSTPSRLSSSSSRLCPI